MAKLDKSTMEPVLRIDVEEEAYVCFYCGSKDIVQMQRGTVYYRCVKCLRTCVYPRRVVRPQP